MPKLISVMNATCLPRRINSLAQIWFTVSSFLAAFLGVARLRGGDLAARAGLFLASFFGAIDQLDRVLETRVAARSRSAMFGDVVWFN